MRAQAANTPHNIAVTEPMPTDVQEQAKSPWWRWALAIAALGAVVLALAPSAADAARQLPWALRRLEWAWVPAGVLAQVLMYVFLAGILAAALGALGYRRVPFLSLIPTSAVFLLTNRALPGPAVAGMAVLSARLRRRGVTAQAGHAVASTFFGADYAGFFLLAIVTLPLLAAEGHLGPLRPRVLLFAALLIALGGIASVVVYRMPGLLEGAAERGGRLLARLLRHHADQDRWAEHGRHGVLAYRQHVAELRQQPGALLRACLWSFAMHAIDAATLVLTARAFGFSVPFPVAAAGYLAGNLGAIVSFLPGGVGLYEGGMIAALHAIGGVPPAPAVAATLLYRLLSLWLPLPAAVAALRRSRRGGSSAATAAPRSS